MNKRSMKNIKDTKKIREDTNKITKDTNRIREDMRKDKIEKEYKRKLNKK